MNMTYTVQEYVKAFCPKLEDFFVDVDKCYQELQQEGNELARQVGLPEDPDGRYADGLWDIVMAR